LLLGVEGVVVQVLPRTVGLTDDAELGQPEVDARPDHTTLVGEPLLEHRPGQSGLGQPPARDGLEPVLGSRIGPVHDERCGPYTRSAAPAQHLGVQLGQGDEPPAQCGIRHRERVGRAQHRTAVQDEAGAGQHRHAVHRAHVGIGERRHVHLRRRSDPSRPSRRATGQHQLVRGVRRQWQVQ
jgi:hypothetical protein